MDGAQKANPSQSLPTLGNGIINGLGAAFSGRASAGSIGSIHQTSFIGAKLGQAVLSSFPSLLASPLRNMFFLNAGAKVLQSVGRVAQKGTSKKLGNSASGTIKGGKSLALRVRGAKVTVPAGALKDGIKVKLKRVSVKRGGFVAKNGEKAITHVYVLKFSKAARAKQTISLKIAIPSKIKNGFYAYSKYEGGLSFGREFPGKRDWSLAMGNFDSKSGIFTSTLMATSKEFFLVAVQRKP